jgi:hypothetical protein
MRPINATATRTEFQVVAGNRPRSLLNDFNLVHAVLLEVTPCLGNNQRCGISQGDKSQLCLFDFWGVEFRDWVGYPLLDVLADDLLEPGSVEGTSATAVG